MVRAFYHRIQLVGKYINISIVTSLFINNLSFNMEFLISLQQRSYKRGLNYSVKINRIRWRWSMGNIEMVAKFGQKSSLLTRSHRYRCVEQSGPLDSSWHGNAFLLFAIRNFYRYRKRGMLGAEHFAPLLVKQLGRYLLS